jgi:Zn-dependent protease
LIRVSKNFFFMLYILTITGIVAFGPYIDSDLTVFVFVVVGWMISVGLHEFGHAYVAWRGGDYTMPAKGYLNIDPLHYADPFNSLILPVIFTILGGIGLPGGAVYIERNLIRSKVGQSLMSAAGPLANLAMLAVLSIPFILGLDRSTGSSLLWGAVALLAFFQATAIVINLIPLPGLDGFGIIEPFLPRAIQEKAEQTRGLLVLGLFVLILAVPPISRAISGTALSVVTAFQIDFDWIIIGLHKFRFWQSMM